MHEQKMHSQPKRLRRKAAWEPVSYSHPVFRPYVAALGQIPLAWNGLHSQRALLFCTVMGGRYSNQFLAVWHAIKSDRMQRDVLEAAARESREIREAEYRTAPSPRRAHCSFVEWARLLAHPVTAATQETCASSPRVQFRTSCAPLIARDFNFYARRSGRARRALFDERQLYRE